MATIYVKTLGCKVNTYDSHALMSLFRARGHEPVEDLSQAAVAVLNTCSVTAAADREARSLLRRFRRENPGALIVATGCYAQTDSAALSAMADVDLVVPNEAKERLVAEVEARLTTASGQLPTTMAKLPEGVRTVAENRQGHFKSVLNMAPADPSQTRAFLKIQDGCNGFCTYCLIPYARGQSRSVGLESVVGEVRRLIDRGVKEIVFTGIHLGDYGRDLGRISGEPFAELLAQLFSWPDMVRIRISSLEPSELTPELLRVLATRRELVCDHFHLPLQSGADSVLTRMRRSYTTQEYAERVALARAAFPDACIGADIIPGFPGETAAEFAATIALIRSTGLNYLHVFPYSKRPNTSAARMPEHLPGPVVKERAKMLRDLSEELVGAYRRRFIGQALPVLWEHGHDAEGRRTGLTPNYLEVAAAHGQDPAWNTIALTALKGFGADGRLIGLPRV